MFFILLSCGTNKTVDPNIDTRIKGKINISADESFKPVIDEEVKVYEAQYPNAHIIVHYKPEQECLKDFGVDSIKMVFATRGFSEAERRWMSPKMALPSRLALSETPWARPDRLFLEVSVGGSRKEDCVSDTR